MYRRVWMSEIAGHDTACANRVVLPLLDAIVARLERLGD